MATSGAVVVHDWLFACRPGKKRWAVGVQLLAALGLVGRRRSVLVLFRWPAGLVWTYSACGCSRCSRPLAFFWRRRCWPAGYFPAFANRPAGAGCRPAAAGRRTARVGAALAGSSGQTCFDSVPSSLSAGSSRQKALRSRDPQRTLGDSQQHPAAPPAPRDVWRRPRRTSPACAPPALAVLRRPDRQGGCRSARYSASAARDRAAQRPAAAKSWRLTQIQRLQRPQGMNAVHLRQRPCLQRGQQRSVIHCGHASSGSHCATVQPAGAAAQASGVQLNTRGLSRMPLSIA